MIFITGGTGLLGMRMAYDLLVNGERLRMLMRSGSDLALFSSVLDFYHGSDSSMLQQQIEWLQGDILDFPLIEEAIKNCQYCIHAAALVSFHHKDKEAMRSVNIEGTANIVNACLGQDNIKLLYISSVAALGRTGETGTIDESHLWKDSPYNSGYAISKYHAEMEVWRGIEEGLKAVMVNPTVILAAGASDRSSGTIFGVVAKGLRFYTDGGASVVDARDVSKIGIALMKGDYCATRFVLNARSLPLRSLFSMVAERMGKPVPSIGVRRVLLGIVWRLFWIKDLLTGGRSPVTQETAHAAKCTYVYDSKKVKELLGVDFQALTDTLDYYAPFYSSEI